MLQTLKQKLLTKLADELKVWGVDFETNYPPEFMISAHAERRFKERVNCTKRKMMKMTVKAWKSTIEIPKTNHFQYRAKYENKPYHVFRAYMGFIFVFRTRYRENCFEPQKLLVTVFKQKNP